MARNKKITPNAIEKIIGGSAEPNRVLKINNEETNIDIEIKTRLSFAERSEMVRDIASMVFLQGEEDTEQYAPYIKKFAIDFNILNYFTNIEMNVGIAKAWSFTENTNIVNLVIEQIGDDYIHNIVRDANELIEYRKAQLLKNTKFDRVLATIIDIVSNLKEKLNGMNVEDILAFVKQNVPEFGDDAAKMFGEIDGVGFKGHKE